MGKHVEQVYAELRELAAKYMKRERADHSLQPTAVVHEAWLRLADRGSSVWNDEVHFLATCARAMRQVLVDHARAKASDKRGGSRMKISMSHGVDYSGADDDGIDVIELDDALGVLRERSERQARVVELRLFAGLTVDQVAETLEVSPRTVASDWSFAQAWLSRELRRGG